MSLAVLADLTRAYEERDDCEEEEVEEEEEEEEGGISVSSESWLPGPEGFFKAVSGKCL